MVGEFKFVLFVLLSLSGLYLHQCYSLCVEVDGKQGNDSIHCLMPNRLPCKSLNFVIANYYSSYSDTELQITITSQTLVLNDSLSLSNISHFILQGNGIDETRIVCIAEFAGLFFSNSSSIVLRHFTMENCSGNFPDGIRGSLMLLNCVDISIQNISVKQSCGLGVAMVNNYGSILIEDSTFNSNGCEENCNCSGGSGGGMHVNTTVESPTHYTIKDCKFINNSANPDDKTWYALTNHGGGLSVNFREKASKNSFRITNCNFSTNKAALGGGINFKFYGASFSNSITVINSSIEYNIAVLGGGGTNVILDFDKESYAFNNSVYFVECILAANRAVFGGGASLDFDTQMRHEINKNTIVFRTCMFKGNKANGGAAVDINRSGSNAIGRFIVGSSFFIDCSYFDNVILDSKNRSTQNGIFFTTNVHTCFNGTIKFENNIGTALYIVETHAHFSNSTVQFVNNISFKGGAILLIGTASLRLKGHNQFFMKNNSASYGGAICAENVYSHYTDTCFIQKESDDLTTFKFIDNKASTGIANDIFVSFLSSCEHYYSCPHIFEDNCIGNFSFSQTAGEPVATGISELEILEPNITAFPGIPVTINVQQKDQYGTSVGRIFSLLANVEADGLLLVDKEYRNVKLNKTMINGREGAVGTLNVQTISREALQVSTTVQMLNCPPGFSFNETTLKCACLLNQFISNCIVDKPQAVLRKGYWIGYLNNSMDSKHVGFGNCDYRICTYNNTKDHLGRYLLPSKPQKLEDFICGLTRQGVLCGECREGYTVYYHSQAFTCGKEKPACSYGVLLYILSEIIPVTFLFIIIILFNIHLTSGSLYSFIFYAQAVDIIGVDAFGTVQHKGFKKAIFQFYKIFYGFFNLDMLNNENLSFCLFKNMNILDIYLVQYFTIMYSLVLTFFTLAALRVNSRIGCRRKLHKCCIKTNTQYSIINGLTAFVVMCYFRCIHSSLHSNVPVDLFVNGKKNTTVVLFNGEYEYLKGDHLKYAIIAFVIFLTIIIPLPLLLLLESLLLGANKLSIVQGKRTNILLRLRLKVFPFLDSFQGCFKDNCRCFAGLYFLYRILLLSPYLFANSITEVYISIEIILLAILMAHVVFKPFQNPWHNKLDVFLLVNIILVTFITLNQHLRTTFVNDNNQVFPIIQIVFMAFPFLYFIGYSSYKVNKKYSLGTLQSFGTIRQKFAASFHQLRTLQETPK